MITYNNIDIGDEVSWTDKGHNDWQVKEGVAENTYKVERKCADMGPDTILVISRGDTIKESFREYEVFLSELF